jgi:RimJ/RimL family protein N-acetyltransferase
VIEAGTAIRTAHLLLRPFRAGDLPAYTAIRSGPETARYLPVGTAGATEAPERAENHRRLGRGGMGRWRLRTLGGRGHRERRPADWPSRAWTPARFGETELLYLLERAAWGRGLATEGARAAIAFARDRLGLAYLVALAMPENIASIAVMRRCGFVPEGPIHIFGMNGLRYGLTL